MCQINANNHQVVLHLEFTTSSYDRNKKQDTEEKAMA